MSPTQPHVWIDEPTGGPLVLVRKVLLDFWGGDDAHEGASSDSAHARAVGEIGCIDMKGGSALVLGDGAKRTTWFPKPQGGTLVRWLTGDDEALVLATTDAAIDTTWMPTGCTFTTAGGVHVLFAAARKGADTEHPRLAFDLREGDYDVLCSILDGQAGASVLVYRMLWRLRGGRR